jgi:hypothetical protein
LCLKVKIATQIPTKGNTKAKVVLIHESPSSLCFATRQLGGSGKKYRDAKKQLNGLNSRYPA